MADTTAISRMLMAENPLYLRMQRQPIGANEWAQSATNQTGGFDPLVGFIGQRPVTQGEAARMPFDPISGRLNESGDILANMLMGASSGIVPKAAQMVAGTGIRAFHGSNVAFDKWDPKLSGSGATQNYFAKPQELNPAFYLTSNADHAKYYGDVVSEFDITGKIKKYNAVPELKQWAKELGYKDVQKMIDEYFDGSVYRALDADNYFLSKLSDAASSGHKGIAVDFGKLVDSADGVRKDSPGKIFVLSDPGMAKRVK